MREYKNNSEEVYEVGDEFLFNENTFTVTEVEVNFIKAIDKTKTLAFFKEIFKEPVLIQYF